jgi:hypothetical protein
MITKNDLAVAAYEELAISGITKSPSNPDITLAVKRCDMMVLGWEDAGICISYVRSKGFNDIDPNQDSGLNDIKARAVILNLAKELCPAFGKPLNPDTKASAHMAYVSLFSTKLTQRESNPYLPTGSGGFHSQGYRVLYQPQNNQAPSNCQTESIKVGETDYWSVDFNPYVNEISGDSIASFTATGDQRVSVTQSSQDGNIISLECNGLMVGLGIVTITVIMDSGRTEPYKINFNVT